MPGAFEEGGVGTLRIADSTVTGNSATLNGGGVGGFGIVNIVSSTIASNSAPTGANLEASSGGFNPFGTAGGATTVQNTIVASPTGGGPNCSGSSPGAFTSKGHNLEDDAAKSCNFTMLTDQTGVDPRLGGLASNGGPTQTRALLAGSPATAEPVRAQAPTPQGASSTSAASCVRLGRRST